MKIRQRFNHSGFFYSIFIPVFLVGMLMIISFSIYTYQKTYQTIQENLIEDRASNLQQIKNNIEQKVKTVEYSFSTYSTTSNFQKIIAKPLTYRSYTDVREVTSQLAYISVMGIENASYELISLEQSWRIANGSLAFLTEEEKNEIDQMTRDSSSYLFWQPKKKSIQMFISLPIFKTSRSAVGRVTIPKTTINQLLTGSQEQLLDIYTYDGQQLFANKESLSKKQQQILNQTTDKNGTFSDEAGDIYLYSKSDYNQWVYVSRLTHQQVTGAIRNLVIGLVAITFVVLILLVFVSYLVANQAARPLREIRDRLEVPRTPGGRKAEINQILGGIEEIVVQNEGMTNKLKTQQPELETLFILNLFRNQVAVADIPRRLAQFGYSEGKEFVTLLIQIDDLGGRQESTRDILLLALEKVVGEILPASERFLPIVLNNDTQATILQISEEQWKRQIITYCQAIRKAAKDYLKIKISFGISQVYASLEESKQAVDNAKEALHFRINLGAEALIFYDEIAPQLDANSVVKYPVDEELLLNDAMRAGDQTGIDQAFSTVITSIFSANHTPITIETALLRLVNNIIQLGQLLGADAEVFQNNHRIYLDVLNNDNPEKIKGLIYHALILPIVSTIQDKTDREIRSLSQKMVHIVHQQYDQEISLDIIADQLHYNPNYLSSVFKKEMQSNFGDYLQNYRLSVAKDWLINTNYTIKELSEKLQYNNPQNFIRFFKKRECMTPGEYRKQFKA
ncbi:MULTISPECIES: helix-turn-helix domain-containing protein [Enterococcus]|uniref:helix-turn-helix domain-containing protein n=1 Tax=Enterococcus TaxID=1350 RepID=UPI0010F8D4BE|nr:MULTISPECIES: helix-turn-helix domain-containing protein [Enterococcus]KAF1300572.1 hypothetical protein BAU16_12285 [Enterococcus sp. JM9B]